MCEGLEKAYEHGYEAGHMDGYEEGDTSDFDCEEATEAGYESGHEDGFYAGQQELLDSMDGIHQAELVFTRTLLYRIMSQASITGQDIADYEYLKSVWKRG